MPNDLSVTKRIMMRPSCCDAPVEFCHSADNVPAFGIGCQRLYRPGNVGSMIHAMMAPRIGQEHLQGVSPFDVSVWYIKCYVQILQLGVK
jgi:hypothetical protein